MLHQTFLILGQLWQLFEVAQILEFLRYPFSLKLDTSPANLLSYSCFSSGKFQSPCTEHLSSPPLLSSLPSESSCLLPCILLLLLCHTASFSYLYSHHRDQEHLW